MATGTLKTPHGENQNNLLNFLFTRAYVVNWELVLYAVILFFAVFTRFYDLGARVMSHDESLHTQFSYDFYTTGNYRHDPMMHGPILFHATAFSYYMLGDNDFSARVYTAVVGVMLVLSPLLFRRWLGKWGALLASFMILISPLILYYSRYIRHDIPSIMSAVIMAWAILMYLNGPKNQRRRSYWLSILAAGMLWNLGSKETAFIYVAIFGAFLLLYWLARMAQRAFNLRGEAFFTTTMISFLLAGVAALMMIVVVSIAMHQITIPSEDDPLRNVFLDETLSARLGFIGDQISSMLSGDGIRAEFATFLNWTLMVVVIMVVLITGPALWAYHDEGGGRGFNLFDLIAFVFGIMLFWAVSLLWTPPIGVIIAGSAGLLYAFFRLRSRLNWPFLRHLGVVLVVVFVTALAILIVEELSHHSSRVGDEPAAPAVPGESTEVVLDDDGGIVTFWLVFAWVSAAVAIGILMYSRRARWWDWLDQFPELDVLIIMGSMVLPWLTAVVIVLLGGESSDFAAIGESIRDMSPFIFDRVPTGQVPEFLEAERVGQVVIGGLAWFPMMVIAIATGLTWNWRRWLVVAAVFYALFAFFFTTVFTNINGLATGMVYSLQYWFEQQGERRGNQPQYYYLLVILPIYEFLPIIGSVLASIAGMVLFWRKRKRYREDFAGETPQLATATYGGLDDDLPADDEPVAVASSTSVAVDPDPPPVVAQTVDSTGTLPDDIRQSVVLDDDERESRWQLSKVSFLLFVGWWGVLNLIGYTLAGEKMPWLGTHMSLPMILLAAWYFGGVFKRIDGQKFRDGGWIYLAIVPLLLVALFQVVAPYLSGEAPFQGTERVQLSWTYQWLGVVGLSAILVWVIFRLTDRTGWRHLRHITAVAVFVMLSMMTIRTAWTAAFIDYDLATEFLVYAHGAPGNRIVYEQLEDMSLRTGGDMSIAFAYDDGMAWPGSWYFREFTNDFYYGSNPTMQQLENVAAVVVRDDGRAEVESLLGDRFQAFVYPRMWWPMQDYFGLTAQRINNLMDFSNANSALRRQGIFDIWWARDYDTFGIANGQDYSLENWPVRDRLYFYVRRDLAAQVWPYGIGDGTAITVEETETSACLANWQPYGASVVFDTESAFTSIPVGLDVGPDGLVYVAEDGGNRISVFDPTTGTAVRVFGTQGTADQDGAFFERPHSVAFAPNGAVYVADTWNHRIRYFEADGTPIDAWGSEYAAGLGAPESPTNGFWGPRDIAIDPQGRVYVADTGNKRVRVYTSDGVWLQDIASGGSAPGQLDEPVGLAIHPDGRLYVADTWNRRVSVFTLDGAFLTSFTIDAWSIEPSNRPYLAIDEVRDLLYVGDPDAGRVLVYDTLGNCVGSFGRYNAENPDATQLGSVAGITVGVDGSVFVVDTLTNRILRFQPFPLLTAEPVEEEDASAESASADGDSAGSVEVTLELNPPGFDDPDAGAVDADAGDMPPDEGGSEEDMSGDMGTAPETTAEMTGEPENRQ